MAAHHINVTITSCAAANSAVARARCIPHALGSHGRCRRLVSPQFRTSAPAAAATEALPTPASMSDTISLTVLSATTSMSTLCAFAQANRSTGETPY